MISWVSIYGLATAGHICYDMIPNLLSLMSQDLGTIYGLSPCMGILGDRVRINIWNVRTGSDIIHTYGHPRVCGLRSDLELLANIDGISIMGITATAGRIY